MVVTGTTLVGVASEFSSKALAEVKTVACPVKVPVTPFTFSADVTSVVVGFITLKNSLLSDSFKEAEVYSNGVSVVREWIKTSLR